MTAAAHHRFFFAIRPDAETAARIDAFAAWAVPDGRRIKLDHQHVTLALSPDYAEVPADLVTRLQRAGGEAGGEAFDLCLDRISGNRRVVVLLPAVVPPPLIALYRAVAAAMARHGAPMREGYGFSPHQALCYRKGGEPFSRVIEGFSWRARELVLVCSHVGQSRHEVIGCWPLHEPIGNHHRPSRA